MSAKSRSSSTPQASAENTARTEPAGLMIRLFALVYDGLLLVALWMITSAILVPFGTPEKAAQAHQLTVASPTFRQFVLFPALVLVTWLFYGYFWTRIGQTLGMQTWRLQVLRADGDHLLWRDAVTRCASACLFPLVCGLIAQLVWDSNAGFLLSVTLGFLFNYLWLLWSARGLAWHDQLSATRVWRLPPEPRKKRRFFGWFSEKSE